MPSESTASSSSPACWAPGHAAPEHLLSFGKISRKPCTVQCFIFAMISAVKAFRVWGLVACEHENCCSDRQQSSRVLSTPVSGTKGLGKCGTGCAPCPALPAPSQHLLGPKRLPEHLAASLCSLLLLLGLVFTLRVSLPIYGLKKNQSKPPKP